MLPDIEKLRRQVEDKLSPERYRHSVAVQKQAVHLAGIHGGDWYKAGVAGLVHDVCHDMSYDEQLNYLRCCGILLDTLTMENPAVWHAICAGIYVEEVLGISDGEIVSAVRFHTTGRRAMSLLEKIVYVADLTSEDRVFSDSVELRALAEQSLDAVMKRSLQYTVAKLVREGNPLIQDAWEAYNYYI